MIDRGDNSSLEVSAEGKPDLGVSHVDQQWLSTILWDGPPPSRDHFKVSSTNLEATPLPTTQEEVSVNRVAGEDEPQPIGTSSASSPSQHTKARSSVSLVLKPMQTASNDQSFDRSQSQSPNDALLEIGKKIIRSEDTKEPLEGLVNPTTRNIIPIHKARENIEEYFGAVMKRALEQLQVTISRGRQSQIETTGTRTHKSIQMARAKAERLKTRFIQEILAKAKNRNGNGLLTDQP